MKQWLLFFISIGFLMIAISQCGDSNQKWSMIFLGLLIVIVSGIMFFKSYKNKKR